MFVLNPLWGPDWPDVRATWSLDPAVAHLNHGSYGAVPVPAAQEQRRLRSLMERDPDRWFRELPDRVVEARLAVAAYCGAAPESLALVSNVSAGVTAVLAALELRPGARIVHTDHGYGAVELALRRAADRYGVRPHTVRVPLDAGADATVRAVVDAAEGAALVIVDQVTSPTARCLPVRGIADACRALGVPVLVDAAHAPGMVADPLAGLDVDFWVGNLHKWACAPSGTAALVAAPPWRERLRPLVVSWSEERPFPQRFDWHGTADLTAWLAAPTAFATVAALDPDRVRRHNTDLADHAQRLLAEALGVAAPEVVDPAPFMRLVPLPAGLGVDTADAQRVQAGIALRTGCEVAVTTWRGRGFLRLSAHVHNHPDEYATLARRLPAALADLD